MQKATEESQFDEPTARLCAWYRGEAGGEAYFLAMAEHGETPDIRQKWQLLGELEHVMGKRLLAAMNELEIDTPEVAQSVQSYVERAAAGAGTGWVDSMQILVPRLETFVRNIRSEANKMPQHLANVAADYVAHEEALLDFAVAEADGRDGSAAVRELLETWQN